MRYYKSLQFKGLQSYDPSKFALTGDGTGPYAGVVILALKGPSNPNNF